MRGSRLWPVVTTVAALGAIVTLFLPLGEQGLAYGKDVEVHVGNAVESAFLLGHRLPPWDWLPDVAGGYGGPNYIFYGHLAFLVPALAIKLGLSAVIAIKVLISLSLVLAAVSASLWCSLFARRAGALLGCVAFVYAPYYIELAYVRGGYPELFALSLVPLAFFLVHKALLTARLAYCVGAGLVTGAIVACHVLSLVLVVPALALYSTAVSLVVKRRPGLARLSLVLFVAATVAAPYLVGPLFETGRVEISRQFQAAELYSASGIPWYSLFNRNTSSDVASHIMPGRVHLLCLGIGLLYLVAGRRRWDGMLWIHATGALLALAMSEQFVASAAVAAFPPLRYLQFPWRFLGLFDLFTSSLVAILLSRWEVEGRATCQALAPGFPVLCFAIYFGTIPPQSVTSFPQATRVRLRESLSTLDHENKYLPLGAQLPKREAPPLWSLLESSGQGVRVEFVSARLNDYTFRTVSDRTQPAHFHQFWYPGWKVLVDGKDVPLEREEDRGMVQLEIPEGDHEIRPYFAGSRFRSALGVLSWLAAGVLLAWVCLSRFLPKWRRP